MLGQAHADLALSPAFFLSLKKRGGLDFQTALIFRLLTLLAGSGALQNGRVLSKLQDLLQLMVAARVLVAAVWGWCALGAQKMPREHACRYREGPKIGGWAGWPRCGDVALALGARHLRRPLASDSRGVLRKGSLVVVRLVGAPQWSEGQGEVPREPPPRLVTEAPALTGAPRWFEGGFGWGALRAGSPQGALRAGWSGYPGTGLDSRVPLGWVGSRRVGAKVP